MTKRDIIIVGPRVLIAPDDGQERTAGGLYLPPSVKEKEEVRGGFVIKTGPGYPVPDTTHSEPWVEKKPTYLPLEAREGDYALFLQKDAVEIEYEGRRYLVVPHSSILALIRTAVSGD